jgi:hypothetical protein
MKPGDNMGKLKYYVIHCADTPPNMEVTKGMLEQWHMGPCDLVDGRVKYKGKTYGSRKALPNESIDGKSIAGMKGRGWDRLGYSELIHRNGNSEIVTPFDEDDFVESDEMTWGVAGFNSVSRHIVMAGGKGNLNRFSDHFTEDQEAMLLQRIKRTILHHPDIIIVGHNQLAERSCPSFNVYDWLYSHRMQKFGAAEIKKV